MTSGGEKSRFGRKFLKFCDEVKLSLYGLVLATRHKQFWAGFIPTFLIFGTLLNLFASGFAAFDLMGASDFGGKMMILRDAFLKTFGVNNTFLDWIGIFVMTLLEACLIGLVILIWKKRPKREKSAGASSLQNSGIVAGLAVLGSGCPTCGTALLTPVLGAIFSGGGYAVAGTVSGIVNLLAILLALWTLKKLGLDAYAIITNERRKRRKNG